ncbi:MAG: hypothetical protein KDK51_07520, partial [Deltaproteobacteria bacterium]|nr:hypothetical protein [Deltaproteobacteria bacterium]
MVKKSIYVMFFLLPGLANGQSIQSTFFPWDASTHSASELHKAYKNLKRDCTFVLHTKDDVELYFNNRFLEKLPNALQSVPDACKAKILTSYAYQYTSLWTEARHTYIGSYDYENLDLSKSPYTRQYKFRNFLIRQACLLSKNQNGGSVPEYIYDDFCETTTESMNNNYWVQLLKLLDSFRMCQPYEVGEKRWLANHSGGSYQVYRKSEDTYEIHMYLYYRDADTENSAQESQKLQERIEPFFRYLIGPNGEKIIPKVHMYEQGKFSRVYRGFYNNINIADSEHNSFRANMLEFSSHSAQATILHELMHHAGLKDLYVDDDYDCRHTASGSIMSDKNGYKEKIKQYGISPYLKVAYRCCDDCGVYECLLQKNNQKSYMIREDSDAKIFMVQEKVIPMNYLLYATDKYFEPMCHNHFYENVYQHGYTLTSISQTQFDEFEQWIYDGINSDRPDQREGWKKTIQNYTHNATFQSIDQIKMRITTKDSQILEQWEKEFLHSEKILSVGMKGGMSVQAVFKDPFYSASIPIEDSFLFPAEFQHILHPYCNEIESVYRYNQCVKNVHRDTKE